MTLPARRRAHPGGAVLLMLVALALLPAFASGPPASVNDASKLATTAAFTPRSAAAFLPVGQFTRATTKKGLPAFLFQEGLPEFWGSCGGTIAINPRSMSPGELEVVRDAAADFATTAAGPWVIKATTATRGIGSVVVVVVDPAIGRHGEWGAAHFGTSFGMGPTTPKLFMSVADATVHLSDGMAGDQSARLARAVTLHELAHLTGADHNRSDPQAIMAPRIDQAHLGYSLYTEAETAGIRLGGAHGCG